MSLKGKLISGYLLIGLVYALYSWLFGYYSHFSFAYNLGRGLVWPGAMFPAFGAWLGGIVMVAVVLYITFGRR
ncbi:hypothetical protein [Pseudomonas sichuanensis]|uniref:hypothetical protein n=1 Tax=Pseudomonas sichuanensis TaxID=2213015 RepID=UPI000DA6BE0F|nr:hypothetical protein [Pseudomonas sichuanensis]